MGVANSLSLYWQCKDILTALEHWDLYFQLRKFNSSSPSLRANKQERRILVQSVILFVNLALLLSAWHHYSLILPDTKQTVWIINCYWIIYCGLNPLLYLTMNRYLGRPVCSQNCRLEQSERSSSKFSTSLRVIPYRISCLLLRLQEFQLAENNTLSLMKPFSVVLVSLKFCERTDFDLQLHRPPPIYWEWLSCIWIF